MLFLHIYFTLCYCIFCLQSIPQITALNPLATAIPLLFVLAASAVKDIYDDVVSSKLISFEAFFAACLCTCPPREFRGPGDKRERWGPLRAKIAENFQGLECNFGKLLLVYFIRPPDLEDLGVMKPHGPWDPGTISPLPPSRWFCLCTLRIFQCCVCMLLYINDEDDNDHDHDHDLMMIMKFLPSTSES